MPLRAASHKSKPAKVALKLEIQTKNEERKNFLGKFINEDEILESIKSLLEAINTTNIPDDVVKNNEESLEDLKKRYSKLRIINDEIEDLKRSLAKLEKEEKSEELQNRKFLCSQEIKHWKKVLDVSKEQEGEVDSLIEHYAQSLESKATDDETARKECLTAITLLNELKKSDQEQNALAAIIKEEEKIRGIEIQKEPLEEDLSALRKNILKLCDELGIIRYDEIPKQIEEFSEILRTTNSLSMKRNCEENLALLANLQKLLKKEKELQMKLASFDKKSEECKIEEETDVELKKDEEELEKLEISITNSLQKIGIKSEKDLFTEVKTVEGVLKTKKTAKSREPFEKILTDMNLVAQLIDQRKKLEENLEQKKKKANDPSEPLKQNLNKIDEFIQKQLVELELDEPGLLYEFDELQKTIESYPVGTSLRITNEERLSELRGIKKLMDEKRNIIKELEEIKQEEENDVEDNKEKEMFVLNFPQPLLKPFEPEEKKEESHKELETFKIDIQDLTKLLNEEEQKLKAEELENLELLKNDLDELPECGERTLVILQSKLIEKELLNSSEEIHYSEILATMKKQFVDENLMNFVVDEYLEKIRVCLVNNEFIKAKSFLKDMRKKNITLLNITELKSLVHKTNSAEERIENQDIVIIVGPSGAGKSTIILYLYGKKMVKKPVIIMSANNEQLQMMTIDGDTPLQGVKSSPQMKSETRFLHVVELDLARVLKDQSEDRKIFISDSPGFGDTAGAEVDISNALGVVNAIQKAKSVKVILTVSGLGDRGAEFKKLLEALIGIIPNVEDRIDSFLILFNKFTPDQAKNIPALITNFSDHQLSPAEKDDPNMKILLKRIKDSAKDENNFINLFNEKPENILFKIINLPAIKKPKDAFKFSISNESRSTLNAQINLFANNILNSYQRKDFPLVKYYLDRMLFLNTILEEEFIKSKYNDCVKFLGDHMRHEFESEIELLNRCFLLENNLKKEDLEKYKKIINSAAKFNDFRKTHLNDFGLDIEMFQTNIRKQLEFLDSTLKSNNLEDAVNGKILEKIHLTVSEFPEYVSLMTKSLDELKKKMMALRDKMEKIMAEFNMEQFGQEMNIMLMIKINLQKFLSYEDYDKFKDRFLKNVDILLIGRVDKLLRSEKISEKDMETLSFQIKQMESIKGNLDIQKHIPHSEIIKKADILMNSLTEYFNKTKENLYEMLNVDGDSNRETFLKKFQIVLKRMTEIKSLSPTIGYALSDTYYAIIACLKSSFDRINNSIRELLNDMEEQKNLKSNFKEIAVNLMILRNSLWIQEEGYLENIFEYKVNKIESDIMNFVDKIYESLRDVHFDFSRKEEILEIHANYKILTQLDILGDDRLLPEIRIKFKEIKESIQKSIEIEVNDKIKTFCPKDFDKVSIASLDAALEYLKQINRKDYAPFYGWTLQSYQALRQYLQDYKNHLVESFNKALKFLNLCTPGIHEKSPDELEKIKIEIDRLRHIFIKYDDFQVFKNYSDLDGFKVIFQEFEKFLSEISVQMTHLNTAGENEKLYDKILLCSYLSGLDHFLDSNQPLKFKSLNEKFSQLFNQKLPKFEQAAYNAIDKKQYLDLVAIFNDVNDSGDPQKHKVLETLKHRLEIALEKDAVEMLSLAKNSVAVDTEGNYRSSLDSAKKIAAGLKDSLMKASQEAKELLMSEKSQAKLKNAINEINDNLEGNILECYNQIEKKYLNLSNFSKFEDLFVRCENIFSALDMKDQYKDIIKKRTDIQTKRTNKLTEIENKYKIFTFDSHAQSKDIAKDLDNLRSTGETSAEYNVVATQIENNLQAQLLEKITRIENEAKDLLDVNTSLERTKRHIQSYFSQNAFQVALLGDIETALDNNSRNKQEKETRLDHILESKDYSSIITFFKDNTARALKTKATDTITKQYEKDLTKISTNLETDIQQSIQTIFETHESITQLQGVFPNETKKITDQIKNAANNLINPKIAAASAIFTKKAETSPLGNNVKESKKILTVDTKDAKKSFKVIFDTAQCIQKDTTNVVSNYFENFQAKTDNLFNNMFVTYQKNCTVFQANKTFEDFQVQQVSVALASAKTWDEILTFIYSEYENFLLGNKNEFLMKLKNLYVTEGIAVQVESLRTLVKEIVKELSEGHNKNQPQFHNQQQAYNFYNTRKKKKDFVIDCDSSLKSYLWDLGKDIIRINKEEKENIKLLATNSHDILDKHDLDQDMCKNLNENLQKLIVIEKNSEIGGEELKQIKDKILARIQTIKNTIDDKNRKANLIQIKTISGSIDVDDIRKKLNLEIDDILKQHKKTVGENGLKILGSELDKDSIGKTIIAEHKIFTGFSLSLFNQRIPKHDIDRVLENFRGDQINKKKLKQKYEAFLELNKKLTTKHLRKDIESSVKELVQELKNLIKDCGNSGVWGAFKDWAKGEQNEQEKEINWTGNIKDSIQDFMAYIFALWTVMNATNFFELDANDENKESYLFIPHPAQILSIFRIFGCGDDNNSLQNNLVQIGTGEGKSVTLAVTSTIFALLGFDVSCACYSEYLSTRDFESFQALFDKLEITPYIHYGTFSKICENVINDKGDLRKSVSDLITTGNNEIKNKMESASKPKILLIDEVDVFFGKDFYGELYTPNVSLKDETIVQLLEYVWREKANINLNKLKASNEFKLVVSKFKDWEQLIEEQTKFMIADVQNFQGHGYVVDKNKIGYKDQDKISFNIVVGYKTLFAYMFEMERGTITKSEAYTHLLAIGAECGNFSYAEIPLKPNFYFIMGVSGTLETLNDGQQKVVNEEYLIKKKTYAPSVFNKEQGVKGLNWNKKKNVYIVQEKDYFNEIFLEIENRLHGEENTQIKRSVIVVFEDKKKLMDFFESPVFDQFKKITNIMTEELTPIEKDRITKSATSSGKITLITKSFGRGTDFICRDEKVRLQGGVHVLQVFFSRELSEEVQIIGRTARQGDPGSFSMILLDTDLEYFLIPKEEFFDPQTGEKGKFFLKENSENYYDILNKKRNERNSDEFNNNKKFIENAKKLHLEAKTFMKGMMTNDVKVIKEFLLKWNKGPNLINTNFTSRTLVLMDATGSMSALLDKCKQRVIVMFERAGKVLEEAGLDAACFFLQFAVYRNYSNTEQDILENSGFENKSTNLRNFMTKITVKGGLGPEAIEIGLWHANQEANRGVVSQVILIGDAPANSEAEVNHHRTSYHGENYWNRTKFGPKTHYKAEIEKLRVKGIKVNTFYVAQYAKINFTEIATYTGGHSDFLDVNGANGEELLTNFVTLEILKNVGDQSGVGAQALVDSYKKKYN